MNSELCLGKIINLFGQILPDTEGYVIRTNYNEDCGDQITFTREDKNIKHIEIPEYLLKEHPGVAASSLVEKVLENEYGISLKNASGDEKLLMHMLFSLISLYMKKL